jgi:hypothetical protein
VAQDTFTDGAGPFSHALAGNVIDRGDNLDAVQTKLSKPKRAASLVARVATAATAGTGAHPVTKVGELMNSID